jgi:hypothetical protein
VGRVFACLSFLGAALSLPTHDPLSRNPSDALGTAPVLQSRLSRTLPPSVSRPLFEQATHCLVTILFVSGIVAVIHNSLLLRDSLRIFLAGLCLNHTENLSDTWSSQSAALPTPPEKINHARHSAAPNVVQCGQAPNPWAHEVAVS